MLEITMLKLKMFWNISIAFMATVLVWAGVNQESYLIFLVLLMLDYITGLVKAFYLGQHITSRRSKYGIASKLSLLIVPIVIGLGGKAVGAEFDAIIFWSMNVMILSEVYSVIGNIYSIRSGQEMPEFDALQSIGKRIRNAMMGSSNE